ncbi:MAG: hypothetical protein NC184_00870 [Roseburia sp.]|nr:hypothetical protein [Roseburia sp.]
MNTAIPESEILRLIDAAQNSITYSVVAEYVGKHFRSAHYMSSRSVCDCIVANLILNDEITPTSADEIITCVRRTRRSLYTTVDSAFFPIKDSFDDYAKTVLLDEYDGISALGMRATNYIVYIISLDIFRRKIIDKSEILLRAYNYDEIINGKVPHY